MKNPESAFKIGDFMDTSFLYSLEIHFVKIGEIVFGNRETTYMMKTSLGSCVGLALYDQVTGTGALAHILLPECHVTSTNKKKKKRGRYANEAIDYMIKKFARKKIPVSRLQAKIVGGASMFPTLNLSSSIFSVGKKKYSFNPGNFSSRRN